MKDDFRALFSSSFCFIEDDDKDDDEARDGEVRNWVEGDDKLSLDGEESLNLEDRDDLGMRIEF